MVSWVPKRKAYEMTKWFEVMYCKQVAIVVYRKDAELNGNSVYTCGRKNANKKSGKVKSLVVESNGSYGSNVVTPH